MLIIVFFTFHACTENKCIVMDMTAELSEQQKKEMEVMGADWIKEARVCDLGEYMVAVPANNGGRALFIWRGEQRVLLIQEGYGVNLYEAVSGRRNESPIGRGMGSALEKGQI